MDVDTLKGIPLFQHLPHRDLDMIARWTDEVHVSEGRHIVDEGEFGYEFFAILEGEADVRHGEEAIARLRPGDFFGEMALVQGDRRTASVVAATPMRLAVMFARDFRSMAADMPEVADRIQEAIRERSP
ncbi:MAG: cyclic nucleotide-binding domain-containing protein [Actinobacteria bacterium]|nr:cyclic nucleotide-binding domain-containing protein [Actinomycetota bacterium]